MDFGFQLVVIMAWDMLTRSMVTLLVCWKGFNAYGIWLAECGFMGKGIVLCLCCCLMLNGMYEDVLAWF